MHTYVCPCVHVCTYMPFNIFVMLIPLDHNDGSLSGDDIASIAIEVAVLVLIVILVIIYGLQRYLRKYIQITVIIIFVPCTYIAMYYHIL